MPVDKLYDMLREDECILKSMFCVMQNLLKTRYARTAHQKVYHVQKFCCSISQIVLFIKLYSNRVVEYLWFPVLLAITIKYQRMHTANLMAVFFM